VVTHDADRQRDDEEAERKKPMRRHAEREAPGRQERLGTVLVAHDTLAAGH
jgi:hypothetical protein